MASIATEPRAALKPYARLRGIVVSLKEAQPAAEGAAPHLIDYTEKLASALREQLKKFFGDRLQKTLESLKWPTRELNITDKLLAQWRQDVELLIDLQTPYVLPRHLSSFLSDDDETGSSKAAMLCLLIRISNPRFSSHWRLWCILWTFGSSTTSAATSLRIDSTRSEKFPGLLKLDELTMYI